MNIYLSTGWCLVIYVYIASVSTLNLRIRVDQREESIDNRMGVFV